MSKVFTFVSICAFLAGCTLTDPSAAATGADVEPTMEPAMEMTATGMVPAPNFFTVRNPNEEDTGEIMPKRDEPVTTRPSSPDSDGDGAPDANDNCLTGYNPDQADEDADGRGNVCDRDVLCPVDFPPGQTAGSPCDRVQGPRGEQTRCDDQRRACVPIQQCRQDRDCPESQTCWDVNTESNLGLCGTCGRNSGPVPSLGCTRFTYCHGIEHRPIIQPTQCQPGSIECKIEGEVDVSCDTGFHCDPDARTNECVPDIQ